MAHVFRRKSGLAFSELLIDAEDYEYQGHAANEEPALISRALTTPLAYGDLVLAVDGIWLRQRIGWQSIGVMFGEKLATSLAEQLLEMVDGKLEIFPRWKN